MRWDKGYEKLYQKIEAPRLQQEGFSRALSKDYADTMLLRAQQDYPTAFMIVDGIEQIIVATEKGKKNLTKYYDSKLEELADRKAQVEGFIEKLR